MSTTYVHVFQNEGYNYFAVDNSDTIPQEGYEFKEFPVQCGWCWGGEGDIEKVQCIAVTHSYTGDWKYSLQRRSTPFLPLEDLDDFYVMPEPSPFVMHSEEKMERIKNILNRKPTTPAEFFQREVMETRGLTVAEVAKGLGVSVDTLEDNLLSGDRPPLDMIHRLSLYVGTSVDVWLQMQLRCDLWEIQNKTTVPFVTPLTDEEE